MFYMMIRKFLEIKLNANQLMLIIATISKTTGTVCSSQSFLPQPAIVEPIPNVTVSAGRDVSLSCTIENLGSYRVAWSHNDRKVLISIQERVIIRNSKYTVSHQNYKIWYLHLTKVDENDHGHYMCQVNTTPMISRTGFINVVVAPRINDDTSSDTDVREGSDVALKCSSSGSPIPVTKWRREDDAEIPIGNEKVSDITGVFLNFTKVSRLNMGAYLCIAANGIPPSISKRVMLNVKFPPMVWIPNQLVGVAAGQDISIDCHLEAFPEPVTFWTKGPNHIVVISGENHDSIVMRSGMYKITMRLRFRAVQNSDYGTYTCVAKNSLGETGGKIRLYETKATTTDVQRLQQHTDHEYGSKSTEFETLSPVSANNWNSEVFNTVWKNPSEKESIEAGEGNGKHNFTESTILQIILCFSLYILCWILG